MQCRMLSVSTNVGRLVGHQVGANESNCLIKGVVAYCLIHFLQEVLHAQLGIFPGIFPKRATISSRFRRNRVNSTYVLLSTVCGGHTKHFVYEVLVQVCC